MLDEQGLSPDERNVKQDGKKSGVSAMREMRLFAA
jgi:hypothetical protein